MSENTERGARREILEILDRLDAIEARLADVAPQITPTKFVITDYENATPTEPPAVADTRPS